MRTASVNPRRIYELRLRAGKTQADIAYAIRQHGHKANERSIRRWESGQHAPHANVVPALAEALGVSIDALYERDEDAAESEEDRVSRLRMLAAELSAQGRHELSADLLALVIDSKDRA